MNRTGRQSTSPPRERTKCFSTIDGNVTRHFHFTSDKHVHHGGWCTILVTVVVRVAGGGSGGGGGGGGSSRGSGGGFAAAVTICIRREG